MNADGAVSEPPPVRTGVDAVFQTNASQEWTRTAEHTDGAVVIPAKAGLPTVKAPHAAPRRVLSHATAEEYNCIRVATGEAP